MGSRHQRHVSSDGRLLCGGRQFPFALALLTFAYFALTRLIVRPVEALVRATDKVASGARSLVVPKAGARELAELASSVQAMTARSGRLCTTA